MSEKRYVFIVEWYDVQASQIKKFNFTYYLKDKAIEMVKFLRQNNFFKYDLKNGKNFLKKLHYTSLEFSDLYIGSVITVFSRQLKFVDYSDVFTRNEFESQMEKTLAIIKPDAYLNIGKVISAIESNGLTISNMRMTRFTQKDGQDFYAEHIGKPFFEGLVQQMSSDLIVGLELSGNNAISAWRKIIGPTDPNKARQEAPNSLRAQFGESGPKNVVHGSDSRASAEREIDFFFNHKSQLKSTAIFENCSLCLIKPHILKERKAGEIIDLILNSGFEISSMQMFFMDIQTAKEFFDCYKSVLSEYANLTEHFTTGPCIAIEVRQDDAINKFRELCGPFDPQIAKTLRPGTIRALFGSDRVRNAVHCSDLEGDGSLEVEYFFNILIAPGWKQ